MINGLYRRRSSKVDMDGLNFEVFFKGVLAILTTYARFYIITQSNN